MTHALLRSREVVGKSLIPQIPEQLTVSLMPFCGHGSLAMSTVSLCGMLRQERVSDSLKDVRDLVVLVKL